MSFMDDCEERAFEDGRAVVLEGFSIQELVDELKKRQNVECIITEPLDYYWITIMAEGDATDRIKGIGEATILTVKK